MATLFTFSSITDYLECEVHRHASGQYSIVIDGYRFFLPEAHSFENVIEHLKIFKQAFDRGFVCTGNVGNLDYLFYDPKNDIPV